MSIVIESGVGSGNKALVTAEKRLAVSAVTRDKLGQRSADGAAWGVDTGFLDVTVTGGRMLYIANTSSNKLIKLSNVWFNWNGGSTNHNRVLKGIMYFGDTAPTTNITTGAMANLNTGEQSLFESTVLSWDGGGNGMTGHTAGQAAFNFHVAQGNKEYHLDGAVIVAPGSSVSFNLQGEENGEASINMIGFIDDKGLLE